MSKIRSLSSCAAIVALAITSPLAAQSRSTVSAATLDAAVVSQVPSSRIAISAALTTPRALEAARSLGVTSEELTTRVASLNDAQAQQVADQVLAGGDSTIVISTTAVIIGLLLIILLTRA